MSINKTDNYGLNLPGYDEFGDIADLNENATIIDGAIHTVSNSLTQTLNAIGTPNGIAPLDNNRKVPAANLPDDIGGADVGTINGIIKADGAGNVSAAVSGTDYATPASVDAKVAKAGDSMSGKLEISYQLPGGMSSAAEWGQLMVTAPGPTPGISTIGFHRSGDSVHLFGVDVDNKLKFSSPNGGWVYEILHEGNIGNHILGGVFTLPNYGWWQENGYWVIDIGVYNGLVNNDRPIVSPGLYLTDRVTDDAIQASWNNIRGVVSHSDGLMRFIAIAATSVIFNVFWKVIR